jgi:MarR family transcriptional regulator, 2-MHQ and catechol-resistance regulon repressor
MHTIDQELKTSFSTVQLKALINVMYTGSWITRLHNRIFSPFDLSMQQYNVLRILRGNSKELNMKDIKSRMIDPTPNLTRLTEKLIVKELIEKVRCDHDRRNIYVRITPVGLELLSQIDKCWTGDNTPEQKLTAEECLLLNELLDKLRTKK